MKIYNTLSEQKEDLDKVLGGKKDIRLFVCGPTVYDSPHLGHARVAIFFDVLKKYMETKNFKKMLRIQTENRSGFTIIDNKYSQAPSFKVRYMQNITDVDDKIIERAHQEKTSSKELAGKYEKEYLKIMKDLGVNSVDKYPRASDHIKEIIAQIQRLMDKGVAYKTSRGVYFEVRRFSDYGKLSKQNLGQLRSGWRIEPDPEKKDPMDFALWKLKEHDYEPSWKSPWGEGRPGWHIEDTAMTEKYFGPQYDIHGGGLDLKFPHHEAEIAQQESASGKKPFVKLWMHVGFVLFNGEKMSKSTGNFITVNDFLKKWSSNLLRLIFLQHHYESPINYTSELAIQANTALDSIAQFLKKLSINKNKKNQQEKFNLDGEHNPWFNRALDDNFNTPEALSAIFDLITKVNPNIWRLSEYNAKLIKRWIEDRLKIFGIELKSLKIPLKIKTMAKKRELYRSSKQFAKSDSSRKEIEALGYTIEDTPAGPFLWPANPKY